MNLIALPLQHLRVDDALPFDLHDAGGRVLMPQGALIADERQLRELIEAAPLADEAQSRAWRERIERLQQMEEEAPAASDFLPPPGELSPAAEASELPRLLAPLLSQPQSIPHWPPRLEALARRVGLAVRADADALLYLLVQRASRYHERYSSEHALLCAVVCALVAEPLQCDETETHALLCAALTMNLSMTALQDELAERERTPTLAHRRAIDEHPALSVRQLRLLGVADELWLGIVSLHHRQPDPQLPFAELAPAARLGATLSRVDVFTAKISARRSRAGLPAPLAARDACLGPNGLPDGIGGAMIKALSIYPPGSYVRLANSEVGVVVQRGARADRPHVVSLLAPNGRPLPVPLLRDTAQPRNEIKAAVRASDVRVPTNHEQVLGLR